MNTAYHYIFVTALTPKIAAVNRAPWGHALNIHKCTSNVLRCEVCYYDSHLENWRTLLLMAAAVSVSVSHVFVQPLWSCLCCCFLCL